MKNISMGLAAMAVFALAATASAQAINKNCPLKGKPVNKSITAEFEGKVIGFC